MLNHTSDERIARLVDPRDALTVDVMGPTVQFLTDPMDGDDMPCVMRGTIPPGVAVPLHSHPEPETFLALSGEVEALAISGDGANWIHIKPGDVFHVPGGARHAFRNPFKESAVSIIVSTGRIGRFFLEVGAPPGAARAPEAETVRRFLETADKYGYWNATPEENAKVGLSLPPIISGDEPPVSERSETDGDTVLPSPMPLMELSTAFWRFKTLAAALDLDLFGRLAGGASTTARELAQTVGIHMRPAEMLLTGCASLGLLEKAEGRYRNTSVSEAYLVPGRPYYFGGLVEMADKRLYAGWGKLTEALLTNRPTTWNPDTQASLFDGEDPKMLALFWEAMHSLSTTTARALGKAVDFGRFERLLDLGGGSGAYDIELCHLYPRLRATVFDLPHVTEIAASKVAEAGLRGRIATAGGDFFDAATWPKDHDVHLFSMILHDWNEAKNRALLRRSYETLESGGMVVVSELLVNEEKTGPAPAALMSLNMLIETEGRNYTPAEYGEWLEEAGFRGIRTAWFDAPGANGAVIGVKD